MPTNQADVARRGLVSINRLDYTLQPDLSVCVSRSNKKHFFQQSVYTPSQRAICILNSGAEYADPQNSYLSFTVENKSFLTANAATKVPMNLGVGSGTNFIKRLILTSRSGDEIERVEHVNFLAPVLDRYMHGRDWVETHGAMIGYGNSVITNGTVLNAGETIAASAKRTFVIPLSCISGLFRSFDRLLPSMLLSGLRIEIEFESAAMAVTATVPDTILWEITKPEITLDQYQLTDSIMRVLNEEAAMRGLEIVYSTFYNHTSSATSTSANVEVRKAVSRALGVLTKIHVPDGVDPIVDYMASSLFALSSYQVRVGSLYFPQQPIKTSGGAEGALHEAYFHTQRGLGKIKTPSAPTSVHPTDFRGVATGGMGVMYTDLERSSVQRLTGIPINNSRVAEVRLEGTVNGQIIDVWLHYVRLLRVFLQNVEVEE